MINYFFQLSPVILAIIAAISCSYRFAKDRRKHDRLAMLLSVVSSLLLIVAQTSWWVTYAIEGNLLGTVFANNIWTVFNSLIMICLILFAQPWRKSK